MICHCDRLFVSFHLDLCTVYHRLAKIDAHVYSEREREKERKAKCEDIGRV